MSFQPDVLQALTHMWQNQVALLQRVSYASSTTALIPMRTEPIASSNIGPLRVDSVALSNFGLYSNADFFGPDIFNVSEGFAYVNNDMFEGAFVLKGPPGLFDIGFNTMTVSADGSSVFPDLIQNDIVVIDNNNQIQKGISLRGYQHAQMYVPQGGLFVIIPNFSNVETPEEYQYEQGTEFTITRLSTTIVPL